MTESTSSATRPRSKPEMNAIGYIMAAFLLVLLLPLLPLLALYVAITYLLDALRGRES